MRALLIVVAVTACGGSKPAPAPVAPAPTPAQPSAPPVNDVLAASALAEQYEVGKAVYTAKKCDTCHDHGGGAWNASPTVLGAGALPKDAPASAKLRHDVTFSTAADVVAFVKATMPIKEPGTLTDDEAYAVVAWILDANKVVLTSRLDGSNAAQVPVRP